ncbi:hypothetical protein AALP_AA3G065900 [Arabis alpina]|uniref:Cystatin domain-containing protein n=1 Tax=Arabis alpina TaxID=50452 RepID=A0A087H7G9_ARAAL|nr:hypothetical protein AALP_AA3G065900 [Arabis alpina]
MDSKDELVIDISEKIQSKRKADDSMPEDYSDGESDVSSREEYQEWDVDSFDEDEKPKMKLDPNKEEEEKLRRYIIQMYQSRGFDVDGGDHPRSVFLRQLYPVDFDEPFRSTGLTWREYIQKMVDLAVERYNQVKGLSLTCEYIVRAIACSVGGAKSYITFMAKETPDGQLVEYQAKTDWRFWQRQAHVIFCRPTPEPREYEESMDDVSDSSSESELGSGRESGQEWDVDSLDDESDFKHPKMLAPSQEEIRKMNLYRPKMYKSKGFYADEESYSGKVVYFSQVDLDEIFWTSGVTGREHMRNMVDLALEKYNEMKGSSVTCESIVRAILSKVTGIKLYITFMAKESPGADLVEYQAKTERRFWQRNAHAILCRPTPKSKD